MSVTVYADILFLINFIIDAMSLIICSCILYSAFSFKKILLSAAFGAAYSVLTINCKFLPAVYILLSFAVSLCMCLIAYGYKSWKQFLKTAVIFYFSCILFGGIFGIIMENRQKIPPYLFFILCFIIFSVVIYSANILKCRTNCDFVRAEIYSDNKKVVLDLICDSGNKLKEPISLLPVIIVKKEKFEEIFGTDNEDDALAAVKYKKRMIPMHTANGVSVITGAKPEKIFYVQKSKKYPVRAYIAFTNENYYAGLDGVFPSCLMNQN